MEQTLGSFEGYEFTRFVPPIRQNGDIWRIIEGQAKLYEEYQPIEERLKNISLNTTQRILEIIYESSPLKLRELRLREYLIQLERRENKEFFDANKDEIYTKYHGKYIVIAYGKIQAIGETFNEVKNVALDTNHRFIFKVEEMKKEVVRLRWR